MSVIFVSGPYGVGKSTLCGELSNLLNVPYYSAGDLISKKKGEIYGPHKKILNVDFNQEILIEEVNLLLRHERVIILAGHLNLINDKSEIVSVDLHFFKQLGVSTIIVLIADASTIKDNLYDRDHEIYSLQLIKRLLHAEIKKAKCYSTKLNCGLIIHEMRYDDTDSMSCFEELNKIV